MKEIRNGDIDIQMAAKAARIISERMLTANINNFTIVITGSVVLNAVGLLDRKPNDIDLSITFHARDNAEVVGKINKLKKLANDMNIGVKLNGSEQARDLVQFNICGVCVDCFIRVETPPTVDGWKVLDFPVMQPLTIFQSKAHIQSSKVAFKSLTDLSVIASKLQDLQNKVLLSNK
jgi:hypothetical protein